MTMLSRISMLDAGCWMGAGPHQGASLRRAEGIQDAAFRNARQRAFTLIEILVVVGIIGVVMTIAIPSIYNTLHQDSMRKAVSDVMEACSHARAQAILNGVNTALRIHPSSHELQVVVLSGGSKTDQGQPDAEEGIATGPAAFTVKLSDRIIIEMLDVNFVEYKNEDEALVHFYPNGTSDEFTMVLLNDQNEARKITLEVVTALADVEVDPKKWR